MYVIAIHDISDPDAFWGEAERLELPDGVELPTTAPSPDGKRAVCIWKADSVDTVRDLVDDASEGIASNEFFAVNDENAQGLPA